MTNKIKNIIFDIGGVLVDFNPLKVLRDMGLNEEEAQCINSLSTNNPFWSECDRGVLPKEEIFTTMINSMPDQYKKHGEDFLYNHILETVTAFDYSADWVKSLKDQGYNIYLLTNYPSWMFDEHWKNTFTFAPYVDGKVVSAKVKLIKPDSEIYKCILEKYNLVPEESVFIDDRLENIQAAKKLGINGIQFTNLSQVQENLNALLKS